MKKFIFLVFLAPLFVIAQTTTELIKVTDMLKIKQPGSVNISNDGSKAVFLVTNIEPEEAKWEYKYSAQLFLVPTDGSTAPRALTGKEPASQPSWSPDGKQIAFVRAVNNKSQIFILSLEGGEPTQLTNFKYGASAPKWSPDGKQILFSAGVSLKDLLKDTELNPNNEVPKWPLEKPGF
ncbi:MAG: TolB family protein, partial [Sediminibacterium sp.]